MTQQRLHRFPHLLARGGVAAVAQALMFTGLYPLVPHAVMAVSRARRASAREADEDSAAAPPPTSLRAVLAEWGVAAAVSAWRVAGFLPLPGARGHGPRPIIVLHGYAMNRANFLPLACRLAAAGLGPIIGFEYWTLGRTASAAQQLALLVDRVLAETGATEVDLIGHSMGGVVGRYYVTFGGGARKVRNLVTIGSPHAGTAVSRVGIGYASRELIDGSQLVQRLAAAPVPAHTRLTVIWSHADALVPDARSARVPGADEVVFADLGHLSLLASRRVARAVIARLA